MRNILRVPGERCRDSKFGVSRSRIPLVIELLSVVGQAKLLYGRKIERALKQRLRPILFFEVDVLE